MQYILWWQLWHGHVMKFTRSRCFFVVEIFAMVFSIAEIWLISEAWYLFSSLDILKGMDISLVQKVTLDLKARNPPPPPSPQKCSQCFTFIQKPINSCIIISPVIAALSLQTTAYNTPSRNVQNNHHCIRSIWIHLMMTGCVRLRMLDNLTQRNSYW